MIAMAVVENVCDRVGVMSLGQIVETGTRGQVFGNPQHACTRRMIEAVPVPNPAHRRPVRAHLPGEAPSPIRPVVQGPQKVPLNDIGGGHLVAYALRTGEAAA